MDYVIIDEEHLSDLACSPKSTLNQAEYVFIIDPIDGTLLYRNKMPLWAISIGIWKNGEPLYGAVYAPTMEWICYSDDFAAYFIEGIFTRHEFKQTLRKWTDDEESTPMFTMASNSILMGRDWREKKIPRVSFNSAVISSVMVMTGKSIGWIGRDSLWDFAGIIPIANKVGVEVYNFKTAEKFSLDMLNDDLKMTDYELICRPKYLKFIKDNTEYVDIK